MKKKVPGRNTILWHLVTWAWGYPSSGHQRKKSYSDRLPEDDWVEPPQFLQYHLFKTEGQTAGCFSLSWRLLQVQDNTTYHYLWQPTYPFAFLDLPLPAYGSSKAKERQTWPPLRLVQCPSLWIRNGQNDVQIFFFSLVFRDSSYLFLSYSSFDHLMLVYFSAIQWISCHLENATRTVNSYTTVHFLSSKYINLKALLSRWYQLHFCSDLVGPES